jgi:hypothetical protein
MSVHEGFATGRGFRMVVHGRVLNGVVVLDNGVRLPEGQEVTVLASGPEPAGPGMEGSRPHSILDIPPVHMGALLRPLMADDDLLGEMLEGRARSMGWTPAFWSRQK